MGTKWSRPGGADNYLEHGNRGDSGLGDRVLPSERAGLERAVREGCLQSVEKIDDDIDELLGDNETAFRSNISWWYRRFATVKNFVRSSRLFLFFCTSVCFLFL